MRTTPPNTMYYGIWGRGGGHQFHRSIHERAFFYDDLTNRQPELEIPKPWRSSPSRLVPRFLPDLMGPISEAEPEGLAVVHHLDGWTAFAFWDRSMDGRGNCVSVFFLRGTFNFDESLAQARAAFPSIFDRFPFAILPAEDHLTNACSFCGSSGAELMSRRGAARICTSCVRLAAEGIERRGETVTIVTERRLTTYLGLPEKGDEPKAELARHASREPASNE